MENQDSVLEEAVISSDDKTSNNEQTSQPSDVEQLKADLLKFKSIAERKTEQLKKLQSSLNEMEDKTSEKVDTTPLATETKSAYNTNSVENSDELNAVKEELFRVKHPEITDEDMSVLKTINADFNTAYNNVAFQSYINAQKISRENANATITKESGTNISTPLEDKYMEALKSGDNRQAKEIAREMMKTHLLN